MALATLLFAVQPLLGSQAATAAEVELTASETLLIEENPALRELASVSPDLLRKALDLIAEAREEKNQGRGGFGLLDPDDAKLIKDNPALLEVWQNSPEASADLLELLKSAAGGGKQK